MLPECFSDRSKLNSDIRHVIFYSQNEYSKALWKIVLYLLLGLLCKVSLFRTHTSGY